MKPINNLHAIVPVKALDQAKSRLACALTPPERRQLTLEMLERVLAALNAAPLAAVWVV
ncbi:MAG: 2-phospho-L-lactate guanylyltransferase, partial [Elioraea tepidiphila]